MTGFTRFSALVLAAALAGCSADVGSKLSQLLPSVGGTQEQSIEAQKRYLKLRERSDSVLQVGVEDRGGQTAPLLRKTQIGDKSTWTTIDNVTLTLQDGVLVASRGLGRDLMSADVSQTVQRLQSGSTGMVKRFHSYLNGEGQVVIRSYVCEVGTRGPRDITISGTPRSTRLMQEKCNGAEDSFQNLYWLDRRSGKILQSRQWVGPEIGMLSLREEAW